MNPFKIQLEIREVVGDTLELVLTPHGRPPRRVYLSRATLDAIVTRTRASYAQGRRAPLAEIGRSLFQWLNGDEGRFSSILNGIPAATPCVHLLVRSPHDLAELPWELLHDGAHFLVDPQPVAVLPIRTPLPNPPAPPVPPPNRSLGIAFMAASADDKRRLDFEAEEARILEGLRPETGQRPDVSLTVEESGTLERLGKLITHAGDQAFDIIHLTGHAGLNRQGTPVFYLEDDAGGSREATASDLRRAFEYLPRLIFLSGCSTAMTPLVAPLGSMSEQLVRQGLTAVLGWARPVDDGDATKAAATLYRRLGRGIGIDQALLSTFRELRQRDIPDWHLLRLVASADAAQALVTSPGTPGRGGPRFVAPEAAYLDPRTRQVRVADRWAFVGRRRLLQESLRALRDPEAGRLGVHLHGQGGRGKSSVAFRLSDRMSGELETVVVHGALHMDRVLEALIAGLPATARHEAGQQVNGGDMPSEVRLEVALEIRQRHGRRPPLIVLDDFEQNQPGAAGGNLALAQGAAETLAALFGALSRPGGPWGRVLVTGRYRLPGDFDGRLKAFDVVPLDRHTSLRQEERLRQALMLERRGGDLPEVKPELMADAHKAADGNPRLFAELFKALHARDLAHAQILAAMREAESEFRANVLARELAGTLQAPARELLRRLLLVSSPVSREAVEAAADGMAAGDLGRALARVEALGLLDVDRVGGGERYRVPRVLTGGEPRILEPLEGEERRRVAGLLLAPVSREAWAREGGPTEEALRDLVELAAWVGDGREAGRAAELLSRILLNRHGYRDVRWLLKERLAGLELGAMCCLNLGRAEQAMGDGAEAGRLMEKAMEGAGGVPEEEQRAILFHAAGWWMGQGKLPEAEKAYRQLEEVFRVRGDVRERAVTMGKIADILTDRGELDEALRIRKEEVLPVYERLGDVRSRAVTMGQISDILTARGELDEALRILKEEVRPIFERLGDVRSRAVTLGRIADILTDRGELDEALRIRKEEELPVYQRLGDVRSRAVTLGRIADILTDRGELDEALRIRKEEELPVYERLGDVRSRAVTLGCIADILTARGELDEALRIRKEEQIPVYERLGDVRSRAVTVGKIADILTVRGELDEALRIRKEEELPVYERLGDVRSRAVTLGKIADILKARGELDEALRIRKEEGLPVYERLGDVQQRAVALGKIADILTARGELDEALRIRKEEELPVFERLGDVRSRAVTMGNIADILTARGALDEALRIRKEEVLPVYERLGDVRSLLVGRTNLALLIARRGRQEDALEIFQLLMWSYQQATRLGIPEARQIEGLLRQFGVPQEVIEGREARQ